MNAGARVRAAAAAIEALPRVLRLVAAHGRPRALVYFGAAAGDDLLCTPAIDGLVASGVAPIWVMSRHPDLFRLNPSIGRVLPYDDATAWALSLLGVRRLRLRYHEYDPATDRSMAPPEHIIQLLARRAGVERPVPLAPRIVLDDAEQAWGRFGDRQIAIQSSVRGGAMPIATKEWLPERFQQVVDALASEFTIVQVGTSDHPPLTGVVDLRGKTTIRQTAAVLRHSAVFIGLVGFLMHLARAVNTRSVIVYGGREHPSQSGYAENVNLFTPLECAPCWLWNRCPYDRECMRQIDACDVVDAARRLI